MKTDREKERIEKSKRQRNDRENRRENKKKRSTDAWQEHISLHIPIRLRCLPVGVKRSYTAPKARVGSVPSLSGASE